MTRHPFDGRYAIIAQTEGETPSKISNFLSIQEATDLVTWYVQNCDRNPSDFWLWTYEEWLREYDAGRVK